MDCCDISLTVYFDGMFWVGVFERAERDTLSVARVVFGAEPKDEDIYTLVCKRFRKLVFSAPLEAQRKALPKNPKRLQRAVHKQVTAKGIGTKSQEALKAQYEARKETAKAEARADKEAAKAFQYALRQEKKKAKHRGH